MNQTPASEVGSESVTTLPLCHHGPWVFFWNLSSLTFATSQPTYFGTNHSYTFEFDNIGLFSLAPFPVNRPIGLEKQNLIF